ncbi:MAG TPA: hypothetical protein VJT15_11075 [Pyrinomonadaceae bacterium]|nr:hypothetical protein [Pyrinomonadaceae bacterium]
MTSVRYEKPAGNALKTILIAGVVAGILDLGAACISAWLRTGTSPVRVAQFIASGILGPAAFTGGAASAALGVACHFLIAMGAAAAFYVASRWLRVLIEWPVSMGLLYGVPVYLFTTLVVVPLSRVPQPRVAPPLSARVTAALIIMFCVGLPIALIVRRFSK